MLKIKNASKINLIAVLLVTAIVCLIPSFVSAAALRVENFGTIQIPGKWQAVKLEDVLDKIEKELKHNRQAQASMDQWNAINNLPDFSTAKNTIIQELISNNINIYQITVEANNCYYTAGLLLYKESSPMASWESDYFSPKTTRNDRREYISTINEFINDLKIFSDQINHPNINVKILPAEPAGHLIVKNVSAYSVGTRAILNLYGINSPHYVKLYVFNLDGHKAYAVLLSNDSERHFWNKTFSSMIRSLR